MKMYRQGDVLIIEARRSPATPTTVRMDNILVHGELTGHAHRAEGEVTVLDTPLGMMVDAPQGFRLTHDEHDTIEIPDGVYLVRRQREYDENEIERYVSD